MNAFVSFASSAACSAPVRTCVAGGQDRADLGDELLRARRRLRRRPGSRRACPPCANSCCAVGRSKPASVAPPIVATEPNLTMPGDLATARPGPRPATPIVSPTVKSFFAAVDSSITTSSGPGPGALDEGERVERRAASGSTLKPRFGRAAEDDRLAVLADQLRLAVDAADRGRDARQRLDLRRAATRRTAAPSCRAVGEVERRLAGDRRRPCPGRRSVKIESNALSIESVSTKVPLTIATPRTIASAVRAVRSFRAEQAPQREPDHCGADLLHRRDDLARRRARASSRTMRPSARKSTRSAIAAARASCVTITIVCP